MPKIHTATQSAHRATEIFRTFSDSDPDLVDLGIPEVTDTIGGMFPGTLVGIAARQNVGKSSLILTMAMQSSHKIGVVELEDGPDVWGARLLAYHTGIKPTKIRRKDLTEEEKEVIQDTLAKEDLEGPLISYCIGGTVDEICKATKHLVEAGCGAIVLNYLQKVRGHREDRRTEVGDTMNSFLRACAPDPDEDYPGAVPVIMSQLTRGRPDKEPWPSEMKESGDIENECRLILMLWRDNQDSLLTHLKVSKSSMGGGGLRFDYRYNQSECLVPVSDSFGPLEDGEDDF